MMEIANPIYDVVFKYLMEDYKVAKILLSALTDLEIIELEFLPQELSHFKDDDKNNESSRFAVFNLSIYRLDFSAKIKEKDGSEKQIIIEVQKSKFTHESMRFRKYLGKQYMNESMFEWIEDVNSQTYKSGIPILPIYFLGEASPDFNNYPVLHVTKTIKDRYSNEVISSKIKFIESLFHEGIIINIRALKKKRRDELEILLSIFDQENRSNHHIMNVVETDFPEKFRPIIRRLQSASQEKKVRDIMIVEDDFLSELNDYENRISDERRLKEEERRLKEEERKLKEEERKLKEEAIKKQDDAIKLLIELGVSKVDISAKLNITELEIEKIIGGS